MARIQSKNSSRWDRLVSIYLIVTKMAGLAVFFLTMKVLLKWVRRSILVLMCLLITTLGGCRGTVLTSEQVVGVWQSSGQSASNTTLLNSRAILHLHPDGTLGADSIPVGLIRLDEIKPGQPLSGTGKWSVLKSRDGDRVQLVFRTLEGYKGPDLPYGAELFTEGSGSRLRLYYSIGDPDDGSRVYFDRAR